MSGGAVFSHAIVRPPGATFADGLTTSGLGAPDLGLALAQHTRYCEALERCGLTLTRLPPDERHPDSTFVEDTAVLTEACAILTRPGAPSRAGEVMGSARALVKHFGRFEVICPPGTVDGGDICDADGHFFIGLSGRTDEAGAASLARILKGLGHTSSVVDIRGVPGILHLKSGMSYVGEGRIVSIGALASHEAFRGYTVLPVAEEEAYAANCIRVNDAVLLPAGFPGLERTLTGAGYGTVALEMSEYRKMDGGLSCLSLRF